MHEGQGRVAGIVEASMFVIGEGLGVVYPGGHTHVDLNSQSPICSQGTWSAGRPLYVAGASWREQCACCPVKTRCIGFSYDDGEM